MLLVAACLIAQFVSAQEPQWPEEDILLYEAFKDVASGCFSYMVTDSRVGVDGRQPGVELLGTMDGEPAQILRILLWHWEPDGGLRKNLLAQWNHYNDGGESRARLVYARLQQSLNRYDVQSHSMREGELALVFNGDPTWAPDKVRPQSRARQTEITTRAHTFLPALNQDSLFSTDPGHRKALYASMTKMRPTEAFRAVDTGFVGWLFLYESEPENRTVILERFPDTYSGGGRIELGLIPDHLLDSFSGEEREKLRSDFQLAQVRLNRMASELNAVEADAAGSSTGGIANSRKWIILLGMIVLGLAVGFGRLTGTRTKVED
jgi:hypothetical protein